MDKKKNTGKVRTEQPAGPPILDSNRTDRKTLPKWPLFALPLLLLFIFVLLFGLGLFEKDAPADSELSRENSSSGPSRDYYTHLKGNDQDTATVMIYMCGSDMETEYGFATADLREMLNLSFSDQVNILIKTGGAKEWQNSTVSNTSTQIYRVQKDGLRLVRDDARNDNMTASSCLSSFIQYSAANYPADRYCLVLWGHGDGSVSGFGHDQTSDSYTMSAYELTDALEDGGCYFDFIGFDAPLSATVENALIVGKYADYLIASQDTEPGCGWNYTGWLLTLFRNPSIPTVKLAQIIIDDFVDTCIKTAPGNPATLSVIDLVELTNTVSPVFSSFFSSIQELIINGNYAQVSSARSQAKEFAPSSQINRIDLLHFADCLSTTPARRLIAAFRSCIKYNRSTVSNANGISVYFPYTRNTTLPDACQLSLLAGFPSSYIDCIRTFATIQTGGQIISGSSGSPIGSILSNRLYSENPDTILIGSSIVTERIHAFWPASGTFDVQSGLYEIQNNLRIDSYSYFSSPINAYSRLLDRNLSRGLYGSITENLLCNVFNSNTADDRRLDNNIAQLFDMLSLPLLQENTDYYLQHYLAPSRLVPSQKEGTQVLHLSAEEWPLIQEVRRKIFIDDGTGYVDLGSDSVCRFDDDGDLILDFDGHWVAINGQIVPYYTVTEERTAAGYTVTGRIPAMLNGHRVDLILLFTDQNPDGTILGAQYIYTEETTSLFRKGLMDLKDGDRLRFICDFYSYDAQFTNQHYWGSTILADSDLTVSKASVPEEYPCLFTYGLSDIYNNKLWTKALNYNR